MRKKASIIKTIFYSLIAGWLSERRYFWDFIRPACIGSCRQSSKNVLKKITYIYFVFCLVIERVEELPDTRSLKNKVNVKFDAIIN
jgi:hypothetical protein